MEVEKLYEMLRKTQEAKAGLLPLARRTCRVAAIGARLSSEGRRHCKSPGKSF